MAIVSFLRAVSNYLEVKGGASYFSTALYWYLANGKRDIYSNMMTLIIEYNVTKIDLKLNKNLLNYT